MTFHTYGLYSYTVLPLDAVPDRSENETSVTTVERREAQRLSQPARTAFARLRGGLDRKSSPKVPRKHLAPPAAPSVSRIARDKETANLGRIDLRRENNVRCLKS